MTTRPAQHDSGQPAHGTKPPEKAAPAEGAKAPHPDSNPNSDPSNPAKVKSE